MRAILIDPFRETIDEVETSGKLDDAGRLPGIYTLLGCTMIDVRATGYARDAVYFDDEGVLGDLDEQEFWAVLGHDWPMAGRGLILGSTADGESADAAVDIRFVRQLTWFPDNRSARIQLAKAQRDLIAHVAADAPHIIVAGPAPDDYLPADLRSRP